MRAFDKTDRGIMDILYILNLMKDKNELFFKNTFRWLIHTHPPLPKSFIVYNPDGNEFKHLTKPSYIKESLWKDFLPGEFIKEKNFSYNSINPHIVYVSKSDWILKLLDKKACQDEIDKWISNWIEYYHTNVDIEREHFKSLLKYRKESNYNIPLF